MVEGYGQEGGAGQHQAGGGLVPRGKVGEAGDHAGMSYQKHVNKKLSGLSCIMLQSVFRPPQIECVPGNRVLTTKCA